MWLILNNLSFKRIRRRRRRRRRRVSNSIEFRRKMIEGKDIFFSQQTVLHTHFGDQWYGLYIHRCSATGDGSAGCNHFRGLLKNMSHAIRDL